MSEAPPIPRATYRLQLNKDFRFADAGALAGYLGRLGISHAYLSPILKARRGSAHGYDTVDHTELNPELGTYEDFCRMAAAFRAEAIGIIADFVPNHMGIGGDENPYWLDVLERGRASRYAGWFDIAWEPFEPTLSGKVLVPFLAKPYGDALKAGEIELRLDAATGSFAVWLHGFHKLPLDPATYPAADAVAAINADASLLDGLIERQHWRPAWHPVGDDDINYRRFFTVSDLAAIRIEEPEVFEHAHRLMFQLIGEGLIEGLRIDHIDGLSDPKAYCQKLRELSPRPIYIVVEKILAEGERLRADWGVEGTTGYEFSAQMMPLLADPEGEGPLTDFYQDFSGVAETPEEIERAAKLRVMEHELAAELEALSHALVALARKDLQWRDFSRQALKRGLKQAVASMPVYRIYVDDGPASAEDRRILAEALADAGRRDRRLDARLLAFLGRVLAGDVDGPLRNEARSILRRVQQFTGPVMAKGLEDTALYRYNRLIALNDVGERPGRFSASIAEFHAANRERLEHLPHSMLATSSHDSKRGEDARARILALSGRASAWIEAVPQWLDLLQHAGAPEIDRNDAYLLFQMLIGSWPTEGDPSGDFAERLWGAFQKSLREARVHTEWTAIDEAYEGSAQRFIETMLGDEEFLTAFRAFERGTPSSTGRGLRQGSWNGTGLPAAQPDTLPLVGRGGEGVGAINSLIQTALKLTVPGVPDIYQGAELWEQSMVDPDNRRPVDFERRQALLAKRDLTLDDWRSGVIKQHLIAAVLGLRRAQPDLFSQGTYEPLTASDERLCAFLRRWENKVLLVAMRLYPWRREAGAPALALPAELEAAHWRDVIGSTALGPWGDDTKRLLAAPLPLVLFAELG